MVKLFGLRITPFFLFIIGLECLALLVSIYIGTLLYQESTTLVSLETIDRSIYSGMFLIVLISILTPVFFYQTKIINRVRKSISGKIGGFIGALSTMLVILFASNSGLDSKTLFITALLRLNQAGCVLLNTESVLFEWLRDAVHPDFKTLSKLIL